MSRTPLVLVVGVIVLVAILTAGPYVYERRIERRVPVVPGNRVTVTHRYGDVDVVGTADSQALVWALVRVSAATRQQAVEYLGRVDIRVDAEGESLLISSVCPRADHADSQFGYDVQLAVSLPRDVWLSVVSAFGDVHIAGIAGASRVVNRYGDVEIDWAGSCSVSNAHGRVRLAEVDGSASVVNSYGDVSVEDIRGRVRVDNSYGVVRTRRIDGDMLVVNRFGNVAGHPQGGRPAFDNRYGDAQTWAEDVDLAVRSILSRTGVMHFSLRDELPFYLGAQALGGRTVVGLPFPLNGVGMQQMRYARQGRGGPGILLHGVAPEFTIGAETPFVVPVTLPEGGQK